jgi:hypothetical protein
MDEGLLIVCLRQAPLNNNFNINQQYLMICLIDLFRLFFFAVHYKKVFLYAENVFEFFHTHTVHFVVYN